MLDTGSRTRTALTVAVIVIFLLVLGRLVFPPPSGSVTTVEIGYVGQGSTAQAEFDVARKLVLSSGAGINNQVLVVQGDRLFVSANVIELSMAGEWILGECADWSGARYAGSTDLR